MDRGAVAPLPTAEIQLRSAVEVHGVVVARKQLEESPCFVTSELERRRTLADLEVRAVAGRSVDLGGQRTLITTCGLAPTSSDPTPLGLDAAVLVLRSDVSLLHLVFPLSYSFRLLKGIPTPSRL